jgi:hypothetical protein
MWSQSNDSESNVYLLACCTGSSNLKCGLIEDSSRGCPATCAATGEGGTGPASARRAPTRAAAVVAGPPYATGGKARQPSSPCEEERASCDAILNKVDNIHTTEFRQGL